MLQKGLPEFKSRIVFLVCIPRSRGCGRAVLLGAGEEVSLAGASFASLSGFSSFPLPSQKRVPVSRRRAVLSHYTPQMRKGNVEPATFSQQERGDWSIGVNLRKLIAGTQELYLVNNSLQSSKSAYEDEQLLITHRISWGWLGTTSQSLQLIKCC